MTTQTLQLYSFDDFVNMQVAAMQAVAGIPLDFEPGSDFLAIIQANSGNALALQAQASLDLAVARLSTSTGSNVDSFVNQFGLTRKQPTSAYGVGTLSRFTSTAQAIIKSGNFDLSTLGDLLFSPVSGVQYSVYIDTTNSYYDPTLVAYVIPIGTASIDVPIVATTVGSIGNVLATQVNTIFSIIANVDSVSNAQPIDTGQDQETDDQLKIRFVLYINGLSKGNYDSIAATTLSVSGVQRFKLTEFYDLENNFMPGFFYDVIDDGTGNASDTLIANVQNAVYANRALGIAFSVYAPTANPISITAHVYTDGSFTNAQIQAQIIEVLTNYILTQSFDATFPYSQVARLIYDTNAYFSTNPNSPIINVNNYLLNGGTSDITLTGTQIMTPGTLNVVMNA